MAKKEEVIQRRTESPDDILLVTNIDIDCDQSSTDVERTSRRIMDPETGGVYTEWSQIEHTFNHREYFEVRWGKKPFRIKPGDTRRLPRYLAEHFAEHLANHMLGKMEEETGRQRLVTNALERPKMIDRIIVGVDQYFAGDDDVDEGQAAYDKVEELNRNPELVAMTQDIGHGGRSMELRGEVDAGSVPKHLYGTLTTDTPKTLDETLAEAGEAPEAPKTAPTRAQLIAEAHKLGIDIKRTDTVDDLKAKIAQF